jgi:FAD/FMN-containing dehydrogenase
MAFEALWRDYHAFNSAALRVRPFVNDHAYWVIVDSIQPPESIEAFLGAMIEDGVVEDCVVAQSEQQARDIWSVREGYPIDTLPNVVNFDVSLPIARIGDFTTACEAALKTRWPNSHCFFYGHIGDSNLHISTSILYGPDESIHSVDDIIYDIVKAYGGSISAEHGIGTLKRDYLHYSRTGAEIALMRRLKAALDPQGILNPGKVI